MRTRWRAALAIAGVAFVLAGCSSAGNSASSTADSAGGVAKVPAAPQQGTGGKAESKVTPPQAGATDRKLSRSARLELTATKVADVVAQARGIALGAGGYTGQESTGDDLATLSLAVPAERLDPVLDQLSHLGSSLVKRELNTQDVTEQVVDVEARLATQRKSVERIRALLSQATSVSDITSIESELTSRGVGARVVGAAAELAGGQRRDGDGVDDDPERGRAAPARRRTAAGSWVGWRPAGTRS